MPQYSGDSVWYLSPKESFVISAYMPTNQLKLYLSIELKAYADSGAARRGDFKLVLDSIKPLVWSRRFVAKFV